MAQDIEKEVKKEAEKNDLELIDTKESIKKFQALEAVLDTEGGKVIIAGLENDIEISLGELRKFKTLGHMELIASLAKLFDRMDLLRVICGAEGQKKIAREAYNERLRKIISGETAING